MDFVKRYYLIGNSHPIRSIYVQHNFLEVKILDMDYKLFYNSVMYKKAIILLSLFIISCVSSNEKIWEIKSLPLHRNSW